MANDSPIIMKPQIKPKIISWKKQFVSLRGIGLFIKMKKMFHRYVVQLPRVRLVLIIYCRPNIQVELQSHSQVVVELAGQRNYNYSKENNSEFTRE